MNRMKPFLLALVVMIIGATAAMAQNFTVSGTIVWKKGKVSLKAGDENVDGKPVAGAKVRIGPGNMTATTDANGRFTISNVPRGSYTMHVKAKEHSSLTKAIVVNENETYDIRLPWKNFRLGKGDRNVQG